MDEFSVESDPESNIETSYSPFLWEHIWCYIQVEKVKRIWSSVQFPMAVFFITVETVERTQTRALWYPNTDCIQLQFTENL